MFEMKGISVEGQCMGMRSLERLRLPIPIDDLRSPENMFDLI